MISDDDNDATKTKQEKKRRKSIDEVTMENWTRRAVVVVDEITLQIDTSTAD